MTRGSNPDCEVLLSTANANTLVCVFGGDHTTWTIEPRGEAYVSVFTTCCSCDAQALIHRDRIGNSTDATAVHLRKGHHDGVSQFILQSCSLLIGSGKGLGFSSQCRYHRLTCIRVGVDILG